MPSNKQSSKTKIIESDIKPSLVQCRIKEKVAEVMPVVVAVSQIIKVKPFLLKNEKRVVHVVLDSFIAQTYGLELDTLKQMVEHHKQSFSVINVFQLSSKDEIFRLKQNVENSFDDRAKLVALMNEENGHELLLPYVFTLEAANLINAIIQHNNVNKLPDIKIEFNTNDNIKSDFDFITSSTGIEHKHDYDNSITYFIVTDGNFKRRFSVERYYDLHVKNWTSSIDSAPAKEDKLRAITNALNYFRDGVSTENDPLILKVLKLKLEYLEGIRNDRFGYPYYEENKSIEIEKIKIETNKQHVTASLLNDGFQTFDDLFKNPHLVNEFIQLLRETDSPCIGEGFNFLRNKGMFVVWFRALDYREKTKIRITDNEKMRFLNERFEGLEIKGSTFRNPGVNAIDYEKTFRDLIGAIT